MVVKRLVWKAIAHPNWLGHHKFGTVFACCLGALLGEAIGWMKVAVDARAGGDRATLDTGRERVVAVEAPAGACGCNITKPAAFGKVLKTKRLHNIGGQSWQKSKEIEIRRPYLVNTFSVGKLRS